MHILILSVKKEYYKNTASTAAERRVDLAGFVGGLTERGLDWGTFGTGDFLGQTAKLFAQMYGAIKADSMMIGPDNKPLGVLDNRRFSAIKEGNYPEFFSVPGFKEYFIRTRLAVAMAVKASMATNSEQNGGIDVSLKSRKMV